MQNMLEAMMLICFGFSWPISLINNYRTRTAHGMSLPFILLIIFGRVRESSKQSICQDHRRKDQLCADRLFLQSVRGEPEPDRLFPQPQDRPADAQGREYEKGRH